MNWNTKDAAAHAVYDTNLFLDSLIPNRRALHVKSVTATIQDVIDQRPTVVRFGDGELHLIRKGELRFQRYDERLAQRLVEIAGCEVSNLFLCIPDVFRGLEQYTDTARRFWVYSLLRSRRSWYECFDSTRCYHNAFLSRPYMDFQDKSASGEIFSMLKRIWEGRDLIIVEGDATRLGVNNDLFESAGSIMRVVCPRRNAFDFYDDILAEVLSLPTGRLVVLALGPTAKPLAYDLHRAGYQAVDIGHMDIEYEWYLRGVEEKCPIGGKFVNEVLDSGEVPECTDEIYQSQIVSRIQHGAS